MAKRWQLALAQMEASFSTKTGTLPAAM